MIRRSMLPYLYSVIGTLALYIKALADYVYDLASNNSHISAITDDIYRNTGRSTLYTRLTLYLL